MNNHDHILDELAVSAIDAADHDPRIDAHVDECETCRNERRSMLEAMSEIGPVVEPPFLLRPRVLEEALRVRPRNSKVTGVALERSSVVDAYRRSVETLDAFLQSLTDEQWRTIATNDWNVREIVVHLCVVDTIALDAIGGLAKGVADDIADVDDDDDVVVVADVQQRTMHAIAVSEAPSATRQRWLQQAHMLINAAGPVSGEIVNYLGIDLAVEAIIADRAFETWLHTQDIRLAIGKSLALPPAPDLSILTDYGARMLSKAIQTQLLEQRGNVRLVLEGDGGGNWLIPLNPFDTALDPTATLILSPLDFCLVLGGRLDVDELRFSIDGDEDAARALLAAAPSLARA